MFKQMTINQHPITMLTLEIIVAYFSLCFNVYCKESFISFSVTASVIAML